jgi:hypothetical protein
MQARQVERVAGSKGYNFLVLNDYVRMFAQGTGKEGGQLYLQAARRRFFVAESGT